MKLDHFNNCVEKRLVKFKEFMDEEVSSLNLPKLDPYELPILKVKETIPFANIDAEFKHLLIEGYKNFIIDHLSVDPKTLEVDVSIRIPNQTISTKYTIKGQIFLFKLNGNGEFKSSFG